MKGEKYLLLSPAVRHRQGHRRGNLAEKHPEDQHTVSATTRTPREGEKDGINYHFMTVADFEDHLAHDQIVEHTKYCENYYGTRSARLRAAWHWASR